MFAVWWSSQFLRIIPRRNPNDLQAAAFLKILFSCFLLQAKIISFAGKKDYKSTFDSNTKSNFKLVLDIQIFVDFRHLQASGSFDNLAWLIKLFCNSRLWSQCKNKPNRCHTFDFWVSRPKWASRLFGVFKRVNIARIISWKLKNE